MKKPVTIVLAVAAVTCSVSTATFGSGSRGHRDLTSVEWNGDWTLKGSASYDSTNEYYQLTRDQLSQDGAIVCTDEIGENFSVDLDYYTGDHDGADGMAVAFYGDYRTANFYSPQTGYKIGLPSSFSYAVELDAYYNQADEAELFINGKSQGVRRKGEHDYHVAWRVQFEPGEIRAVSRKDGKMVCSQTIHTAGQPDHIRLSVDYKGKDLTFITAEVVDKDGNLCPWADNQIYFKGDVVATDNGCQTSMERFTAPTRKAFHGKCLVVVRGSGTITAQSIDLRQSSLDF